MAALAVYSYPKNFFCFVKMDLIKVSISSRTVLPELDPVSDSLRMNTAPIMSTVISTMPAHTYTFEHKSVIVSVNPMMFAM